MFPGLILLYCQPMKDFQRQFLEYAIQLKIIRFGEFTLKSGRISPYFFNAGLFNTGSKLAMLGKYYAEAAVDSGVQFDMLFGPAYKGIPLVATTAIALAENHKRDVPYAFDRKEAKKHAEGGSLVGAPLAGNVMIVDDVISSGLSAKYATDLIRSNGAHPACILIALDRQEKGLDDVSAVQEVKDKLGLEVISIVNLDTLVAYLSHKGNYTPELEAIHHYRSQYGC